MNIFCFLGKKFNSCILMFLTLLLGPILVKGKIASLFIMS